MDRYKIIRPSSNESFADALASVLSCLTDYLAEEKAQGRDQVFVRFFLSDAQNQAPALRDALEALALRPRNARTGGPLRDSFRGPRKTAVFWGGQTGLPAWRGGYAIVEQPPLDGSRIAALVWTSPDAAKYLFHSLRLTEEEAAGKTSYEQSRLLFNKYLGIIKPLGLDLKTHCIRTWIYVRDIDSNYAGLVKARNDVFAEEGLSHDTHYIASTGIGGANEVRSSVVAIDFLTAPGIVEEDKTYLKALSHLSPTHDYGVAFERGVRVKDHVFISGTASIDHKGRILHEGDVLAQADRLLENIGYLLDEGCLTGRDGVIRSGNAGTGLPLRDTDLPFARRGRQTGQAGIPYFIIYLRDIADYAKVDAYMQARFPDTPRIILEARVCRPGWLIEMECETSL